MVEARLLPPPSLLSQLVPSGSPLQKLYPGTHSLSRLPHTGWPFPFLNGSPQAPGLEHLEGGEGMQITELELGKGEPRPVHHQVSRNKPFWLIGFFCQHPTPSGVQPGESLTLLLTNSGVP